MPSTCAVRPTSGQLPARAVRSDHTLACCRSVARVRRILAASWFLLPGFGIIDLTVTWNPDWPQVLEAGWGLFISFFVGIPFAAIALRPVPPRAAAVQLYVAAAAILNLRGRGRRGPLTLVIHGEVS